MHQISNGQCGLCTHFGEHHSSTSQLVEIRTKHEAPEDYVDACGHPKHAPLHLQVTAQSGCDGFELANAEFKKN